MPCNKDTHLGPAWQTVGQHLCDAQASPEVKRTADGANGGCCHPQVIEHEDELLRSDDEVGSEDELDSLEQKAAAGNSHPTGPASTSLTATQADQALLEAAMSSAVHHPNVVQTYHYRTVQPSKLASGDAISRAVRVRLPDCPAATWQESRTADAWIVTMHCLAHI